jgi:hypothetical protein
MTLVPTFWLPFSKCAGLSPVLDPPSVISLHLYHLTILIGREEDERLSDLPKVTARLQSDL